MKNYELLYITDPSNEESIEDTRKRIEGIITGREGTVTSFNKLGKKRLAYPIQKRQYGVYFLVNLDGDGRIVEALDYFLRLNPIVLRHIILNLTEKQLKLKDLTERIQKEEAERMRMGGRPIVQNNDEEAKSEEKSEQSEEPSEVKADKVETEKVSDETSEHEEPESEPEELKPEAAEEEAASEAPVEEEPEIDEVDEIIDKNME